MRPLQLSYMSLGFLLCSGVAFAQTTSTTTPSTAETTSATNTQAVTNVDTPPKKSVQKAVTVSSVKPPPPPVVLAPPELSNEQKLLIENAQKLDVLNKELLTRNQQLQVTNEKLSLQVEILKHDRYSEGTRDTLISIIVGILLGWLLFRTKKRPRYRDF